MSSFSNISEYSVTEISQALKNTVETTFGHVRVRGEISRITVARSGHLYTSLKDEKAVLDAVCWRGTVQRLSVIPAEGMEVICTGRLTTYPGRSNYQLIIESMALAGEGALLKMLEERRKRLADEGLFDPDKKKKVPFLPTCIGVITSPTGAVIRDILHRVRDRFPRPVLLWPVMVQGQGAADKIAAAIAGFNALPESFPRPDVLIVARGGGSLEDLMVFNEENVVRAVVASTIPVISAIGHETDTTLIDYAADIRAPTPTAAAELAVPVRADLAAMVMEQTRRLVGAAQRNLEHRRTSLTSLVRSLGHPASLLDTQTQRLDMYVERLSLAVKNTLQRHHARLNEYTLLHPKHQLEKASETLNQLTHRLHQAYRQQLSHTTTRLYTAGKLLESYSFKHVLKRGYSLVTDQHGTAITAAAHTKPNQKTTLHFHDGQVEAVIQGKNNKN